MVRAGRTLTPILIFDQFEEIFTLAQSDDAGRKRAQEFLADLADLVLVAPATARLLSAYANGYSHDLLTNVLIATRAPVSMLRYAPRTTARARRPTSPGRRVPPGPMPPRVRLIINRSGSRSTFNRRFTSVRGVPQRPLESGVFHHRQADDVGHKKFTLGFSRNDIDQALLISVKNCGK